MKEIIDVLSAFRSGIFCFCIQIFLGLAQTGVVSRYFFHHLNYVE